MNFHKIELLVTKGKLVLETEMNSKHDLLTLRKVYPRKHTTYQNTNSEKFWKVLTAVDKVYNDRDDWKLPLGGSTGRKESIQENELTFRHVENTELCFIK